MYTHVYLRVYEINSLPNDEIFLIQVYVYIRQRKSLMPKWLGQASQ